MALAQRLIAPISQIERFLLSESRQWPLWAVVFFGIGIASWWGGWLSIILSLMLAGLLLVLYRRCYSLSRGPIQKNGQILTYAAIWALALVGLGQGVIAAKSAIFAPTTLERPFYGHVHGRIDQRMEIPSRQIIRLWLELPERDGFPALVRLNLAQDLDDPALQKGALIKARVRLMPPNGPSLPGAYDFARYSWFAGIGASGRILERPQIIVPSAQNISTSVTRHDLARHVRERLGAQGAGDGAAAIGATLASGDRGAISEADAEAMRRSGLAHLLSISGLHVSALIFAVWLVVLKIFALFPWLALRVRLPLLAAGIGALAGIGYTLLTGAEVPTVRACIGALLILLALVMGRDPLSMRLLAVAGLAVMILWPESLSGPSFQHSFAAVAAIIALHDLPIIRQWGLAGEYGWWHKLLRFIGLLFLTGLVVELTLSPIAIYHFNKSGLYGALANIIAIPLTSFVIMPALALALLFDLLIPIAPLWGLVGLLLDALVALAHFTASRPGAVAVLPSMAPWHFALFILGGLWLFLWRSKMRLWGLSPIALAIGLIWLTPAPDLWLSSDGRQLVLRDADGQLVFLRERMSDYNIQMFKESAGFAGDAIAIRAWQGADCSPDFCTITIRKNRKKWIILASLSKQYVPLEDPARACQQSDIVIADRGLPRSCRPKRLKLDRWALRQSGGVTIRLNDDGSFRLDSVAQHQRGFPWWTGKQF